LPVTVGLGNRDRIDALEILWLAEQAAD